MKYDFTGSRPHMRAFALALLAMVVAAATAHAQRFQNIYGFAGSTERQNGGALQTANGEYVTCGATDAFTGKQDVYVIRMDASGATLWDNVYVVDPSFPNYATNVKECVNGDIIVTGVVQTSNVCPGCLDVFVMRLDATGAVLWTWIYGDPTRDEVASDIVETAFGNGITTNAGDFVISGSSNTGAANSSDGYMFRIRSGGGGTIWERIYDVQGLDDDLRGLDEMAVNFPGDIIATGMTMHFNIANTEDIWVMRVDGNTGVWVPNYSAMYGLDISDVGNSIQELQFGGRAGDVVVCGYTWLGSSAYVLEIDPVPACMPMFSWNAFDDGTNAPDEAKSVREITSAAVGTPGDVVVVGTTSLAPLGGTSDIFLQQFAQGSLAPVGAFNVYGGSDDDYGEEVGEAPNPQAGFTDGFVIAGITASTNIIPPGDVNELYFIKTDNTGDGLCNWTTTSPNYPNTGFVEQCTKVRDRVFSTGTFVGITPNPLGAGIPLCFSNPKIVADPVRGGATIAFDGSADARRLAAYPNPVVREGVLGVAFELDPDNSTTLVVSDVLGREVYRRTVGSGTNRAELPVAVEGWPAGTYTVTVSSGHTSTAARVVVTR